MRIILRTVLLCLLLLAAETIELAQNPTTKSPRRKSSVATPRFICLGEKVPEGFIVAGYKFSANCGNKPEVVFKRPAGTEVVCAASPIPGGFRVVGLQGSPSCATPDSNPLTNAIVIQRDGLVSSPQPRPSSRSTMARPLAHGDGDEDIPSRETGRHVAPKVEVSSDFESPSPIPSREDIEIAVRRSTVIIGMTMQDVSRAWGKSHTTDSLVEKDRLVHIWVYRRGEVYFHNGVVYKILLLKG